MSKVLAVDDSPTMRKIILGSVDLLGYDLFEAGNGQEALELLEHHYQEVDLILLDINMPVKDGLTTLQEIKENDRFKHIPVMMITTESEKSAVVKAIQLGAQFYVTKPFVQQDLATKIMECLVDSKVQRLKN